MRDLAKRHAAELQSRLRTSDIDLALITDEDSITYLAAFWGYFGMEFGRPSFVLLPANEAPVLITPQIELDMARAMTWIEDIRAWQDGGDNQWDTVLADALGDRAVRLGVDARTLHPPVRTFLEDRFPSATMVDLSHELADMRTIKSPEEIAIMRKAGDIALAMADAAKGAIGEGVPEFEAALAVSAAGTRKAAEFLTEQHGDSFVSPVAHTLQVMQSGANTTMAHMRASMRRFGRGDPVYFCFCSMARFMEYKLGFDRNFFIGEAKDEHAQAYEIALAAQDAVLGEIKPGAVAEEIHQTASEVYLAAGHAPGYRTGRAIGISNLETPEFKIGDKTVLREGMTMTADAGITISGQLGIRLSDSVVVTATGNESLTPYPRDLLVV
jgi:Xaa-Pro aminopeptidase